VIPSDGITQSLQEPSSEVLANSYSTNGENATSVIAPVCPLIRGRLLSNLLN